MKKVTFIEKGQPFDFKRVDSVKEVYYNSYFVNGGLTYFLNKSGFIVAVVDSDDILILTTNN